MASDDHQAPGSIAGSSRDSLASLPIVARKNLGDLICEVVGSACRSGERDLSMREIQRLLDQSAGRHIDMSTISARVNELVCAKRLTRDKYHPRRCTVTGKQIEPLSMPLSQARLCA